MIHRVRPNLFSSFYNNINQGPKVEVIRVNWFAVFGSSDVHLCAKMIIELRLEGNHVTPLDSFYNYNFRRGHHLLITQSSCLYEVANVDKRLHA